MNIQPNNQTVENCLKDRTYYIDFYQREYVWDKDTVITLLNDIFYSFELGYEEHKNKDLSSEVIAKYNWYYLNIYITNTISGKEYIVDGQQRLSTLCLIALKLYHLANDNEKYFKTVINSLKDCIFGEDKYKGEIYWIDNDKRAKVMDHLLFTPKAVYPEEKIQYTTEKTLLSRYSDIDKYIDDYFTKDKIIDVEKLKVFILYFLERLVLVELKIEKDDTPMVFEVINDRGVALKPFEILKGKLIGALDKDDTEKYSEYWENSLNKIRGNEDNFFIDYLKGKFIFKRNAELEKAINNEYHRYIFSDNDIANKLSFRKKDQEQLKNIKNFIENDLVYYTDLYAKIKQNDYEFLSYNKDVNDLSGQYQNILSACNIKDTEEQKKIETIAKEIDRLYILLNLNGVYNSNYFAELQYNLNEELKGKSPEVYRDIFNSLLTEEIKKRKSIQELKSLLEYDSFFTRGYDTMTVSNLRYLFARVEKYICEKGDIKTIDKKVIKDISTKTGEKTGYHIEHILSRNEENESYFSSEEEFDSYRNKLGALLLLKGRDNISSGNESYSEGKVHTYTNPNALEWAGTLVSSFYHSNPNFEKFNKQFQIETGVDFHYIENFNKDALEYRSKLLYAIIKKIWEVN